MSSRNRRGGRPGRAGGRRDSVRIIGGSWRGRRLQFPDRGGVRPTPDRVRETLFNWLQPLMPGARCLDAFAGTGALGLEALSRGAAESVFVERDRSLARAIRDALETLEATGGRVVEGDGMAHLRTAGAGRYDIVFLDPPYASGLAHQALELVAEGAVLAPGGRVYVETATGEEAPIPEAFELLRSKEAGQVGYRLLGLRSEDREEA